MAKWRTIQPAHKSDKFTVEEAMEAWRRVEARHGQPRGSRSAGRSRLTDGASMEAARKELFVHIHRCGVLTARPEDRVKWMKDATVFLGERYPSLSKRELDELKATGLDYCRLSDDESQAPGSAEIKRRASAA